MTTPDDRRHEINRELADLAAGKVLPGGVDRVEREQELWSELDQIEGEAGEQYRSERGLPDYALGAGAE